MQTEEDLQYAWWINFDDDDQTIDMHLWFTKCSFISINFAYIFIKTHLILWLGLNKVAARTSDDNPAPTARMINLDNVDGAWKEAKEATVPSRMTPRNQWFWTSCNIPGMTQIIGRSQIAANASYPEISSSFRG